MDQRSVEFQYTSKDDENIVPTARKCVKGSQSPRSEHHVVYGENHLWDRKVLNLEYNGEKTINSGNSDNKTCGAMK